VGRNRRQKGPPKRFQRQNSWLQDQSSLEKDYEVEIAVEGGVDRIFAKLVWKEGAGLKGGRRRASDLVHREGGGFSSKKSFLKPESTNYY